MSNLNFVLYNYPPSITTEKIRWLLDYYGIPFEDRRIALSLYFIWVNLINFPKFRKSVPYLIDKQNQLFFGRPKQLLEHFDPQQAPNKQLLPPLDQHNIQGINSNIEKIGSVVRLWAYSHITPEKEIFLGSITAGAPQPQKNTTRFLYPIIKAYANKTFPPDSQQVAEAHHTLVTAFDQLDILFSDQRPFVLGKKFSWLDIELCVHAAPCVMAEEYAGGGVFPELIDLPEAMRPLVEAFRQRPSGQYVLRMYREQRLNK